MKWWKKQQHHHQIVPSIEQQRAEKLADLGSTLSLKRQEKQLSLAQVETQTRIRSRFLRAIEAGKLDELPEPVYIQSFIQKYAEVLGLDGKDFASTFPVSDRQLSPQPDTISLPPAQLKTPHLYVLYVLMIIGTVTALSQILSRSEMPLSNSQMQKQPTISVAKPNSPKQPQKLKSVNPSSTASKTNKPVQVGMTLKAESWMRVVADGKKQFEGLLPQGTQRTWVANEQLKVRVGNAGGVLVTTVDQKDAKPLGELGQVQEVTFGTDTKL
jgi:cytoskeletal protein RodZ